MSMMAKTQPQGQPAMVKLHCFAALPSQAMDRLPVSMMAKTQPQGQPAMVQLQKSLARHCEELPKHLSLSATPKPSLMAMRQPKNGCCCSLLASHSRLEAAAAVSGGTFEASEVGWSQGNHPTAARNLLVHQGSALARQSSKVHDVDRSS